MPFQILGFRKVPDTDPQEFEIRFKDLDNIKPGYSFSTESGTEPDLKQRLKEAGLSDAEIEILFRLAA